MSEAHSLIGASSAYRWMNCPGSVRLYTDIAVRRATEYAATGTAAHEVCERCLKGGKQPDEFLGEVIPVEDFRIDVTSEMVEAVRVYVNTIRMDQHRFGGKLVVEQSFSLDWLHPGMFGRNDASLVPELLCGTLRVYDYKNGRKPVEAKENPQCMYYALGALGEDNPGLVETVECTIVQPNAFGKQDAVDRWEISVDDLYEWGREVLRPAAKRTEDPDAPLAPGEWCAFCEASALCPARQEAALSLLDAAVETGQVAALPRIDTLSPGRIGALSAFFQSEEFGNWVKSLAAEEQSMLARGVEIPGRKLVETIVQGNRRWVSEEEVTRVLGGEFGGELLATRVKSPAQVEKLLASRGLKKEERESLLADLITRDEAVKTIVVSTTDGRAALADEKQKSVDLFD